MKGIFQPGDLVHVKKTEIEKLTRGDVIVFSSQSKPLENSFIVHRIVDIKNERITTKGDNCSEIDNFTITDSDLIGRVSGIERQGKIIKMSCGFYGLLISKTKFFLRKNIVTIYKILSRSSLVKKIMRSFVKISGKNIRKIKLISKEGQVIKWVYKNTLIAKMGPDANFFYCRKPFDLIVKDSFQDQ